MKDPLQHILAIVGPTASGKSALSMALYEAAKRRGQSIELISMDSALVYRGMDIGTAKPTKEKQEKIPHHGIDIIDPWDSYSAAKFSKDVRQWAADIRGRNNIPVIIGGTMLYWRALTQGLSDIPPTDPLLRIQLEEEALQMGWPFMHEKLMRIDPVTASRLPPGDSQRISRALEVYLSTGKPISDWIAQSPYGASRDDTSFPHTLISLEPQERSWLHERIAARFYQMLELGFLEEMQALMNNPQVHQNLPSMRAVGYRQAWQYLTNQQAKDDFIQSGIAATRQLAKRQLTWLRAMPSRIVMDPSQPHFLNEAVQTCLNRMLTKG